MIFKNVLACVGAVGLVGAGVAGAVASDGHGHDSSAGVGTGSVVFVHPDGASAATWAAARALHYGPDGDLNWDALPAIAVYRGHMRDSLTATSNGGGTSHAFGVKVDSDAFGRSAGGDRGTDLTDASGRTRGVALRAIEAGIPVGLVQTGIAPEPGTAVFVAPNVSRRNYEQIAAQLLESGAAVLFSGGEKHFVPEGVAGVHGVGERTDGRDLIAEARALGYTVVRTRAQLLALPADTGKVLGLFAHGATFNAEPEEELAEEGLGLYVPGSPTVAEMTEVALRVLRHSGKDFLLVVEEEATDNFGNKNNAAGVLEAAKRADDAIGVAQRDLLRHPDTLLITTADSDAGGMRMSGIRLDPGEAIPTELPERDRNGSPIDGVHGTGSAPFIAAADQFGQRHPFAISWATREDVGGGILVRADGLNSHRVRGSFDNTEIADLIALTLFGSVD
ncbi:MAG: alkaline phosphatase [Planctomycetota bacterium]